MFGLASTQSRPAQVQVASAAESGGIKGFFANLFGSKREQAAESGAKAPASGQSAAPAPNRSAKTEIQATDSKRSKVAVAKPEPTPSRQQASSEPEAKPANTANTLAGAAPIVPAGVIDNRFGAWH
jgi:hypothetical protein